MKKTSLKIINFISECGFGGCLMELMIQLAIIMIGKQFLNALVENLLPILMKNFNAIKLRWGKDRDQSLKRKGVRYIADLKLVEFGSRGLFPEYLEMSKLTPLEVIFFHQISLSSPSVRFHHNLRRSFSTCTTFRSS